MTATRSISAPAQPVQVSDTPPDGIESGFVHVRLHPLGMPLSQSDRCSCGHRRWRHGSISGCHAEGCACTLNWAGVAACPQPFDYPGSPL